MAAADSPQPIPDAREWGRTRQMSGLEAFMWRAEADPVLRSHVLGIEILDCVPDWDRLLAAHDWATRVVPRFRQRVVEPLFNLGSPVWATDGQFDLSYHLRRVSLPGEGSQRDLLDYVQAIAMAPLDISRAQWEAVLIDGLQGGRAAYVLKLNHALTDGLGAMELLKGIHSQRREPTPNKSQVPLEPPEQPTALSLLGEQVAHRLSGAPRDALRSATVAAAVAARGLGHPRRTVAGALDYVQSMQRVYTSSGSQGSPLLKGRSRAWWFDAHDVPLVDFKAAAKSAGGSVNDAFLAALLGAFRLYHEHFDVEIATLPVAIPISVRRQEQPMGGNRIAGARLLTPIGEADPAVRIRRLRELVAAVRVEPAVNALELAAPVLSRLPGPLLTRVGRAGTSGNDMQASSVLGIQYPVYIAGARVTHLYPFGPLPGCAAMITLVSHNETCCIGANVDRAAVTDTDVFAGCLRAGFDEVLALGPGHRGAKKTVAPEPTSTTPTRSIKERA